MDRMKFIPGAQAKEEIHAAQGHIFFDRKAALDYADTFVREAPGGYGGPLALVYQSMLACLSENDRVDIWFGLRDADPSIGETDSPSGEKIGHTWATVTESHNGAERHLWEVGQRTPPLGDKHATRAFNAYRSALAAFLGIPAPSPVPAPPSEADLELKEFNSRPIVSRALAPSNLYYSSARMWYFVDLAPPGRVDIPAILSRPMRAFDALILSALMAVAMGAPPLVFGVSNSLEGLGKMPVGYTRVHFEGKEDIIPEEEKPLLVM